MIEYAKPELLEGRGRKLDEKGEGWGERRGLGKGGIRVETI